MYGPNLTKTASAKERFDTYFPYQGEIIKKIDHLLKPDMSVLDVGCSAGFFLSALKGRVKKRVGVELNPTDVLFIKKNLDFKVYDKPLGELEINEGPFDLITSFQVLEHVDNPIEFLKTISKNLKTNGWLYLELPNINDVLLSVFQEPAYENFYYREPHVSYFSAKTLKRALSQAGFKGIIKTSQRYNLLNHLNWHLNHQPQANFTLGNSSPILIKNKNVKPSIARQFNNFITKADRDYKKIVEKNGLGESLCFLGKKIK
jgi:2-polyprenyl-3-methyl-5-hydroxy-6-metoxy-1,4-benzoquinol methylase